MSNFLIDEDTDLLAAEFVLGTLDSEERANAQSLLRMDHGFIAMVRIWERRFGELHLMVEPVEPDPSIVQRIKAKIAELPTRELAPEGQPPLSPAPGSLAPMSLAPGGLAPGGLARGLAPGGLAPLSPAPASPASPDEPLGQAPQGGPPAETPGASATGGASAAMETPKETPKLADSAAEGEIPKPDATAGGESLEPQEAARTETMPTAEVAAAAEAAKPAETPPGSGVANVAEIPPVAESRAPEGAVTSEGAPSPQIAVPAVPPPPPADKSAAPTRDRRPDRRAETAVDAIRSRGRWRAFGIGMTVLVVVLGALLAAWRFVPDRLPARLQPAQLMMSLGIQSAVKSGPTVKPAPPESQFDE